MTPKFVTLWEFSPYWFHAWPFVPLLVILLVFAAYNTIWSPRSFGRAIVTFTFAAPILGVGFYSVFLGWERHVETSQHVRTGAVSSVEGVVESVTWRCNYTVQRFTVRGVLFDRPACGANPGFSPGSIFQPTVKSGQFVRVRYFNAAWGARIITKFEVSADTPR
jgi:hypothetical protein